MTCQLPRVELKMIIYCSFWDWFQVLRLITGNGIVRDWRGILENWVECYNTQTLLVPLLRKDKHLLNDEAGKCLSYVTSGNFTFKMHEFNCNRVLMSYELLFLNMLNGRIDILLYVSLHTTSLAECQTVLTLQIHVHTAHKSCMQIHGVCLHNICKCIIMDLFCALLTAI